MAELDLRDGAPEQTIARIERALASIAADAVLPADHAWIGEAYLLLGRAHAQRNDAERAKAAEAQARAIIAALPTGHPLRDHLETPSP